MILPDQALDEANLIVVRLAITHLAHALKLPVSTVYPGIQKYLSDNLQVGNQFIKRRLIVTMLIEGSFRINEVLELNSLFIHNSDTITQIRRH
jgi:hypothetical protein